MAPHKQAPAIMGAVSHSCSRAAYAPSGAGHAFELTDAGVARTIDRNATMGDEPATATPKLETRELGRLGIRAPNAPGSPASGTCTLRFVVAMRVVALEIIVGRLLGSLLDDSAELPTTHGQHAPWICQFAVGGELEPSGQQPQPIMISVVLGPTLEIPAVLQRDG